MANHPEETGILKSPKKAIFYGWWVIASLFFVELFGPMGRYSLTALSPFIEEELVWSKSQISLAFSIHLWVYACLVLLVGWLVDRIGSRRIFFIGGIVLIIGLSLLSRLNSLWQLYLFFGVVTALGVSMTHMVPVQATSRKWFIKRAGLAGGILAGALGMGAAILTPVLTVMASSLGWRTTWFICAILFGGIIMLLAVLVIRNSPESIGLHPDGTAEALSASDTGRPGTEVKWTVRKTLCTSPLWLLFIYNALYGIPLQGMMSQIVMWGVDLGEPLATAGIFMSAFTLPTVLFSTLGGWLGDRYGKRRIMIFANGVCLLVMLFAGLLVNSRSSLLIIAPLFGAGTGMVLAPVIPYAGDLYGRAVIGTLAGILIFSSTFFGGFGPLIWGAIADATGTYNPACLLSAALFAVSIIALLLIRPEKLKKNH